MKALFITLILFSFAGGITPGVKAQSRSVAKGKIEDIAREAGELAQAAGKTVTEAGELAQSLANAIAALRVVPEKEWRSAAEAAGKKIPEAVANEFWQTLKTKMVPLGVELESPGGASAQKVGQLMYAMKSVIGRSEKMLGRLVKQDGWPKMGAKPPVKSGTKKRKAKEFKAAKARKKAEQMSARMLAMPKRKVVRSVKPTLAKPTKLAKPAAPKKLAAKTMKVPKVSGKKPTLAAALRARGAKIPALPMTSPAMGAMPPLKAPRKSMGLPKFPAMKAIGQNGPVVSPGM
ncbi:hypothetical protein KAU11_00765 [Candidatus Babeliales bacterium]|nr:hypothetical protein [Candidatus Babeliales bacterium]